MNICLIWQTTYCVVPSCMLPCCRISASRAIVDQCAPCGTTNHGWIRGKILYSRSAIRNPNVCQWGSYTDIRRYRCCTICHVGRYLKLLGTRKGCSAEYWGCPKKSEALPDLLLSSFFPSVCLECRFRSLPLLPPCFERRRVSLVVIRYWDVPLQGVHTERGSAFQRR